jgi:hypothetical protein
MSICKPAVELVEVVDPPPRDPMRWGIPPPQTVYLSGGNMSRSQAVVHPLPILMHNGPLSRHHAQGVTDTQPGSATDFLGGLPQEATGSAIC